MPEWWDTYLFLKTAGIAVFVFAGGISVSKNLGISRSKAYLINSAAVFAGFFLSKTWFVVQHLFGREPYEDYRNFFHAWDVAGSVLYGWVLGGTLAIVWLCRHRKLDPVRYLDCVLPWLLVAQFLNRLGCLDAGCCWGRLTNCPVSVYNDYAQGNVHPVQLYEAVFDLLFFWFIQTRPKRRGFPTYLYFMGYPAARFLFEFLRGDNQPALFFMTVPQVTSILILAVVLLNKKKILSP